MPVYDALYTHFKCWCSEVDEEPQREVQEAQIRQQLFAVGWSHHADRLQLDDQATIHEQIDPKALLEAHSVEFERNGLLTLDLQSTPFEHARKNDLIDGLEQSRSQPTVQMKAGIHNDR
jgi:hypothetical protein